MKKIHEKLKIFFDLKILVKVIYGLGIFIVILIIFSAGMSVGFHKATFGHAWGENYERNFGVQPGFNGNNFPNAHGAVGKIIKIELPTIIVQDKDNTEKVILIKDDTKIEKIRNAITSSDLKINDFIIVIGTPDDQGQIEAKFIRIMPAPGFLNK